MNNSGTASSRLPGIIKWSALISFIGALAVILSGYGYQLGVWGLFTAFRILIPVGSALAVIGGLVAFITYLRADSSLKSRAGYAFPALAVALLAAGNFFFWYSEVQTGYPPIHDITTDLENPPEFVAIAPLRADAPNPTAYPGAETAEQQREFYTDLNSLYTGVNYDSAYTRALQTARSMPWNLVAHSREDGRIEAWHKLPWFGFIDDVVIRVDTTAEGARIDMRSKSRLGRGDLGVNAKRINTYFTRLGLN